MCGICTLAGLSEPGALQVFLHQLDLLAKLVVTLPDEQDEALVKFAEDWRARRPYTPGR